ncbi:MAG TPA: VWA domain-containing protein [Thermoanaerobaculia bacterium]|nr:VWA domain-containing protein [Thermoanaerobaculia bacterium]
MSHRRAARRLPLLTAVGLLAAAGLAAAQDDSAPPAADLFVDQVSVEIVNVDVTVTDGSGRPITGLTAEDFVVVEDGEERPITNFSSFRSGEMRLLDDAARTAGDLPEPTVRRRMAILFDNNSLEKRDRARAIEDLERFVLEQFDGSYEWAVIAYGDELQLMQPFTADKTTVLGALGRVDDLPIPVRRRRAADATYTESEPFVSRSDFRRGRRGIDQTLLNLTQRDFELRERMWHGLQQFDHTTAAIVQTMRAYMGLDGRKSLVLVTGAMEVLPGGQQLLGRGLPTLGSDDIVDPMIATVHAEVLRRYDAIIKIANAAGFSIYPVAADALMQAKSSYIDAERDPTLAFGGGFGDSPAELDVEGASRTVAAGTGGRFYSTTNFYDAFDDIDDRTANSYVLGFATDHDPEGGYHRIAVRTKRPGLQVRHRQGYLHLTREQQIAEELATPLAFPKDGGDFPIRMEVHPPEGEGRKKVTLLVAGVIPMSQITLLPQGEDLVGRVHVLVTIYDREGNVVDLIRERQDVRVAAAKAAAAGEAAPARFGLRLREMPRGEYTITLTLIDDVTDRYGTGLESVRL